MVLSGCKCNGINGLLIGANIDPKKGAKRAKLSLWPVCQISVIWPVINGLYCEAKNAGFSQWLFLANFRQIGLFADICTKPFFCGASREFPARVPREFRFPFSARRKRRDEPNR